MEHFIAMETLFSLMKRSSLLKMSKISPKSFEHIFIIFSKLDHVIAMKELFTIRKQPSLSIRQCKLTLKCLKWFNLINFFTTFTSIFLKGFNFLTKYKSLPVYYDWSEAGKPYWRGRISTVDLLVLISWDQLLFNFPFLQMNQSELGGQTYWAFPFSNSSLA